MEIHPPQVTYRPQPLIDQILKQLVTDELHSVGYLPVASSEQLLSEAKQAIREVIERGCDPYGDGWEPEPPVDPDTFRQSPDENLEMARRYDLSSKDNLETRIEIRDSILRELFGEEAS